MRRGRRQVAEFKWPRYAMLNWQERSSYVRRSQLGIVTALNSVVFTFSRQKKVFFSSKMHINWKICRSQTNFKISFSLLKFLEVPKNLAGLGLHFISLQIGIYSFRVQYDYSYLDRRMYTHKYIYTTEMYMGHSFFLLKYGYV